MTLCEIRKIFQAHQLWLECQGLADGQEFTGAPCVDSRELQAGDIFVCIKGQKSDGHKFVPLAREKQAALIVVEDPFTDSQPAIRVSDTRKAAALLAKLHYHNPSSRFRLTGITGTNGKTTTSMLLFKAVRELSLPAGWIGTLGYYINERHYETQNTTPDILELNRILADMAEEGVKHVFMEVSSHALALDRVYGLEFDYCLFTNLTREHLDFHHNMEEYGATKLKLFEGAVQHTAVALINTDDSFGTHIFSELKDRDAFVFSVGSSDADYTIRLNEDAGISSWQQSRFALSCPDGVINIRSPLIGSFNIANLALSAASLNLMGFEKRQIEQGLNAVQPVRGRFERVPNTQGIGVFVDYAHTPAALENILKASREFAHGRVLCLFGAGGDRDKGKRPLMLKAALQHADAVVITDDNPRNEDPDAIIRDIITGTDLWLPWWIIRDRKEAIHSILRLARPVDIVLLCGKGHETYQETGSTRQHFDDREVAAAYLEQYDSAAFPETELILPVDRLTLDILLDAETNSNTGFRTPATYNSISTDSRTIQPQALFFALQGPNFDGHDFLNEVLRDASALAVGSIPGSGWPNYLQAGDPLILMAKLHRKFFLMFGLYKIALTGSTGKSGTKEMLGQVLSIQAPILKTSANENNLIGLCRTIARVRPEQRYAILELGTNAPGEIAALCEICSPDAGIILNIGPSHLEKLGSEDGVFVEKSALFNRPLDLRLFDADDPRFASYAERGKSVGYSADADFRLEKVSCADGRCRFEVNGQPYDIPYPAPFHAKNAAFAIAAGLLRNCVPADIQRALDQPAALDMRLQLEKTGRYDLLVDCYNANPVSMQAAIEYWKSIEPERDHVAILADMLELGDQAALYHDMVAAILIESGHFRLLTVGELSVRYHAQDTSLRDKHFATAEELLASSVLNSVKPGSVILIKGSHSMHLEKLLPALREGN